MKRFFAIGKEPDNCYTVMSISASSMKMTHTTSVSFFASAAMDVLPEKGFAKDVSFFMKERICAVDTINVLRTNNEHRGYEYESRYFGEERPKFEYKQYFGTTIVPYGG